MPSRQPHIPLRARLCTYVESWAWFRCGSERHSAFGRLLSGVLRVRIVVGRILCVRRTSVDVYHLAWCRIVSAATEEENDGTTKEEQYHHTANHAADYGADIGLR